MRLRMLSLSAALSLFTGCGSVAMDPDAASIDAGALDAAPRVDATSPDAAPATTSDASASDAAAIADAAVIADASTSADAASTVADAGACGAHGGACCPGGTCVHPALTCAAGICQGPCGSGDDACCVGSICTDLGATCDPATKRCIVPPTLPAYSICGDPEDGRCAIPSMCFVSLLDTRPMPASTCTVSCADSGFCPSGGGRTGVCVETPGGPQCYLSCAGTDTCTEGFVCVSAPGELGDYLVCVPGDDP